MSSITPFNQSFVIRVTLDNMQRGIDLSIRKTVARLKEFDNQPAKKAEVLQTLRSLEAMYALVEEIRAANAEILKGE